MTPARPAPPSSVVLRLFVPGQLINPLNARTGIWASVEEALRWKRITRAAWLAADRPQWWGGPAQMQLVGYVGRLWDDHEGLGAAMKHIRDEAVRLMLDGNPPRRRDKNGKWYDAPANDGPESEHLFLPPRQEVRPKSERGVLIMVEARYPSGRDRP